MSDLFDIPETLSPKLAWMRKHDCLSQRDMSGWMCHFDSMDISPIGNGITEDEAILDLCNKTGVSHWTIE